MNDIERQGRELLAKFNNSAAAQRARKEAEAMGLRNPRTLDYLRIQARALGIHAAAPTDATAPAMNQTDKAIEAGVKAFGAAFHKMRALARAWRKNDAEYAAKQSNGAK